MNKDISRLLNEAKAETGWSETDLAAKTGVSQPTINRILNGQQDCKGSTWAAIEALHKSVFSKRKRRKDQSAAVSKSSAA